MNAFDTVIDRKETASIKHDLAKTVFGKEDILPMWVADMDFETPSFVREAVIDRAKHPVFGYTFRDEAYYQAIIGWMKRRHKWDISKDWILFSPGVVPALNFTVLALTDPGDEIIVQSPVYFPFFTAISDHGRKLVNNTLVVENQTYLIDFDLLEEQAKTAKMLILCNPHNPVGRSWTKPELERVAGICLRNKVIVLSDEIHNDLVLPPHKHTVFANLSPEVAAITITAHSPSKTFNLAGLAASSLIIPDEKLRNIVKSQIQHLHLDMGNIFGFEATKAAFNLGDEWLDELIKYLKNNVMEAKSFLQEQLPGMVIYPTEATYLMWLDFAFAELDDKAIHAKLISEAGLWLSPGKDFGAGGENKMRLNVACPLSVLQVGLQKIAVTFKNSNE